MIPMWYKVYATFGPGHQSKDTFYRWSNEKLDEDGENELVDEMMQKWRWTKQIEVDVDPVDTIPEDVRDGMIRHHQGVIRGASHMLDILVDPTKTPITPG